MTPQVHYTLGRLEPSDWKHVELYGLELKAPAPTHVKKILTLPAKLKQRYNQGQLNACVGFSSTMYQAILNTMPGHDAIWYDAIWVWRRAKAIDEFPDTKPNDNEGTSVRAGADVIRTQGIPLMGANGQELKKPKPDPAAGISSNWWVANIDQMRAAIDQGVPVEMGTLFAVNMMDLKAGADGAFRMPDNLDLKHIAGGHAWVIVGADDDRECFYMPNTWGEHWPDSSGKVQLAEVPYNLTTQLIAHQGEGSVFVDKATGQALGLIKAA